MKSCSLPITLLGWTLLISFTALAQKDSSGIFNTAEDYKAGKLSYAINYKTEKHKINDYMFLNAAQVKVKHKGEIYLLDKNKIYGYRDTRGRDYRFVEDKSYEILNSGEPILIYKYSAPVQNPKAVQKESTQYYFTKDAGDAPMPLTKENLKKAYPKNHRFHDAIDQNFRSDNELTNYDEYHKMYKMNWLYKENR